MSAEEELALLGRELGGLQFVQGPGGNVSVKSGNRLLVKASGTRLRELPATGTISDVPLALARAALEGGAAETELFACRPRPSLESLMHALDGRVVAHTHPVALTALACSARALPRLPIEVTNVPYAVPGAALAAEVASRRTGAPEQTFLLRNHGLLVYCDSPTRAVEISQTLEVAACDALGAQIDLSSQVRAMLATPVRRLGELHGLELPCAPRRAPLFPDAVVFCHHRSVVTPLAALGAEELERLSASELSHATSWVLQDDLGERLLLARSERALAHAVEVVAAFDAIALALRGWGEVVELTPDEAEAIQGLASEKYRQRLLLTAS